MSAPRPVGVTLLAVAAILLGLSQLCTSPASLPLLLLDPAAGTDQPALRPYVDVPWLLTFARLGIVLSTCGSSALVAAGIGLFFLKPWARTLALVWAGYAVLWTAVREVVMFAKFLPLLDRSTAEMDPETRELSRAALTGGLVVDGCLWLGLAAATLIVFTRPSIQAAFGDDAAPGAGPRPYEPPPPTL
jgi:hypothetical protein